MVYGTGGGMLGDLLDRFTEGGRQVVVLAEEEARALAHDHVGTEHILLGLSRGPEGVAAGVLESLGVTAERLRGQVVAIVGHGEQPVVGQIPFTSRARKVLERAAREALGFGHDYIGPGHILLGLVGEKPGAASEILFDEFGVAAERVRGEVIRLLLGSGRRLPGPSQS